MNALATIISCVIAEHGGEGRGARKRGEEGWEGARRGRGKGGEHTKLLRVASDKGFSRNCASPKLAVEDNADGCEKEPLEKR